jgi:hypothetical protein
LVSFLVARSRYTFAVTLPLPSVYFFKSLRTSFLHARLKSVSVLDIRLSIRATFWNKFAFAAISRYQLEEMAHHHYFADPFCASESRQSLEEREKIAALSFSQWQPGSCFEYYWEKKLTTHGDSCSALEIRLWRSSSFVLDHFESAS